MSSKVFSISPSQKFEGNDGNWSTFAIGVGTSPATLRVLPATSGSSVWVVNSSFCVSVEQNPPCADRRGLLFDPNKSNTWKNISDASGSMFGLNFAPETPLNTLLPTNVKYSGSAVLGTDIVVFGSDNNSDAPVLENQLIAAFEGPTPFFGVLGLSAFNETPTYSDRFFSVLGAWNASGIVERACYGYTAGASYRDNTEVYNLGSLTFGGYDASRGNGPNALTVPMTKDDTGRALTLNLKGLSLTDGSQPPKNISLGIPTLIDSLVPEIWIPQSGWSVIEEQFGLEWNETYGFYFVNDTQHEDLTNRNIAITFSLAANTTSAEVVDITLPYAALQPRAGWPLLGVATNTSESMRYFPIRRASDGNNEQFYLGRVFLQEAYLAVDYDLREFKVSPTIFPLPNSNENLVAIGPLKKNSSGIDKSAIAGIVVGILAALILAASLLWWFYFRKRTSKDNRKSVETSSLGGTTLEIVNWNAGVQREEPELEEHYNKPLQELSGEAGDHPKPELDATATAVGPNRSELSSESGHGFGDRPSQHFVPVHRHELSGGTVRRISDQSRPSVSPLDERSRRRQTGSESLGWPSPENVYQQPGGHGRFGTPSPQLSDSHPSPPIAEGMRWSSEAAPVFELHGRSRDNPAPETPAIEQQGESTALLNTLRQLEGSEPSPDVGGTVARQAQQDE